MLTAGMLRKRLKSDMSQTMARASVKHALKCAKEDEAKAKPAMSDNKNIWLVHQAVDRGTFAINARRNEDLIPQRLRHRVTFLQSK